MNKELLTQVIKAATDQIEADIKQITDSDVNNDYDYKLESSAGGYNRLTSLVVTNAKHEVVWRLSISNGRVELKEEAVSMP